MFRRFIRDYLSLTRGQRRGMRVLAILILLLASVRGFMPLIYVPSGDSLSGPESSYLTLVDSLKRLDSMYRYNPHRGQYPADRPDQAVATHANTNSGLSSDFRQTSPSGNSSGYTSGFRSYRNESFQTRYKPIAFELNTADSARLVSVYGIGPVFARRIIRYRELLGGYYSYSQLMEVYGLKPKQLEELRNRSFIDTLLIRKLDLNHIDEYSLARHPYLSRYQAASLLAFREHSGEYGNTSQILSHRLLPDSVFLKMRPYLITEP